MLVERNPAAPCWPHYPPEPSGYLHSHLRQVVGRSPQCTDPLASPQDPESPLPNNAEPQVESLARDIINAAEADAELANSDDLTMTSSLELPLAPSTPPWC